MYRILLCFLLASLGHIQTLKASVANKVTDTDTLRHIVLDEVDIITSVKENGSLRQQSASTTIIDKTDIANNHVTSLKNASSLVPNLFIPDYGSRLTSAIYIRGIGSRINTPAVGLYVDGIPYIDKSAFDFHLFDIERVDVMRGPQGVLYGRNTMGGLIRIHSKNPFYYDGTDIRLSAASADMHRSASLTHYHRVSSKFAFSAGGYYEGSEGFFKNSLNDKRVDDMLSAGGRVRGIFKATERLSFDMNIGIDYSDEGAYPYFYTGSLNGNEQYAELKGSICNNRESRYRRGMVNAGANIEYRADSWMMNAITSYQGIKDRMMMDQDFIKPDIYTLEQKQRINTLNEEVTFKNSNRNQMWQWVSGANIMVQGLKTNGPVTFYDEGVSSIIEKNTNNVFAALKEQNPKMPAMSLTMQDREFVVTSDMKTPTTNLALFHQSSLNIGDFTITGGLRLEYEKLHLDYSSNSDVTFDFNIQMPAPIPSQKFPDIKAQPMLDGSMNDDNLLILPKLSVMYHLPYSTSNVYATASKGYRSGGYNIQMFSDIIQALMRSEMISGINTAGKGVVEKMLGQDKYEAMMQKADVNSVVYKPEYSWNFEFGTHLDLIGKRLQVDAAAFLINTYDQQIARFAPTGLGRMMVNAGKSRSYGAELSARWLADQNLTLMANYGYTHATFVEYDDGKNGDFTGNHVPFVPEHNVNADAAYRFNLAGAGLLKSINIGANITGTGRIYWTEQNNVSQNFYALFGARTNFDMGKVNITIWGKNLTGKRYNTFYFESASRGFEQHGKPLQIGLDINIRL